VKTRDIFEIYGMPARTEEGGWGNANIFRTWGGRNWFCASDHRWW